MVKRIHPFAVTVWKYYRQHGRHGLPWRCPPEPIGDFDPYKILVSEVMLQQTQVLRVIPKYEAFLKQFPTVQLLAEAPLSAVLRTWNGLGYNRRAKFLHQAAQRIVIEHSGKLPMSTHELVKLPGIGSNTAGAVLAYAFNIPAVFLETNIRTVYIHHFFPDQTDIPDKEILRVAQVHLDSQYPRQWYWALMDYGAHLKRTVGNLNRSSQSYAKQSKFEGSKRQLRGKALQLLGERSYDEAELQDILADDRAASVVGDLLCEGLIQKQAGQLVL